MERAEERRGKGEGRRFEVESRKSKVQGQKSKVQGRRSKGALFGMRDTGFEYECESVDRLERGPPCPPVIVCERHARRRVKLKVGDDPGKREFLCALAKRVKAERHERNLGTIRLRPPFSVT